MSALLWFILVIIPMFGFLVATIYAVVREFRMPIETLKNSLNILKERLSKGEITPEEYESRKNAYWNRRIFQPHKKILNNVLLYSSIFFRESIILPASLQRKYEKEIKKISCPECGTKKIYLLSSGKRNVPVFDESS